MSWLTYNHLFIFFGYFVQIENSISEIYIYIIFALYRYYKTYISIIIKYVH